MKGCQVPKIEKDAIFLIDGSYLLYRSYYGLRPLRTAKGIPTQATYGFCRAINKLVDDFDPQNIVLVWDSKGPTFRKKIYEAYKATRQAPPSDLFSQKEQIIEFADLIKLKQVSKTGYEADDLIGSIAQDRKADKQIVIVGPDKDLYQLLDDKIVVIFDPFKDRIIDVDTFKKEKGFDSSKVSFFYSLLGDTSDNIPGVKGIGKKTAEDLVKNFDSLEDLYKNLDKVKKERTRNLLEESKDNAFLSLKLFTLKHYELNLKLKDFAFDKNDWVNAAPLFQELEFKSLLKSLKDKFGKDIVGKQLGELEQAGKTSEPVKTTGKKESQLSLFGVEATERKDVAVKAHKAKKWKCHIVRTEDDLENLIKVLKEKKLFAFDTETSGLRPMEDSLVGFSFATNKKEAYYIPVAHVVQEDEEQLERDFVLEKLKSIFVSKQIKKILHHAKFDQLVLRPYEIEMEGVVFDTLLAANLLRKSDWDKINLKVLSARHLDEKMQSFKEVLGKHKKFSQVPIEDAAEYAAHDALQTFKLKPILEKELKKDKKIEKIFKDVEMPLCQVLLKMEQFGITLDSKKLEEVGKELDKELKKIENKIESAVKHKLKRKTFDVNLNSPQQVEKLLFDQLKLPVVKRSGKTKRRATDQEVLSELGKVHPIPGLILKYRELAKLRSTYTDPLIKQVNEKTGRIHTSFSQIMVATGRLSSSDPNLQNIPASADYGIKIRSAFKAPREKMFLAADYSQVELRVLAHMTKDKNLSDAFLHNHDIHKQTAAQIFDVSVDKVTNDQRQVGKRINFSIIYGLTPYGLSRDLDIKPSEAKEYIDKYFATYKGVTKFIEKTVESAKKNGYVQTWLGRRRYVPEIYEKNKSIYEAAKRVAINSPVQGTSAEIMKLAMINLNKEFEKQKLEAQIILQIHDELVIELPQSELKKVEKMVKKCMEGVVKWEIPFKISINTGKNWGQVTK